VVQLKIEEVGFVGTPSPSLPFTFTDVQILLTDISTFALQQQLLFTVSAGPPPDIRQITYPTTPYNSA
jgi:hypothetical protein